MCRVRMKIIPKTAPPSATAATLDPVTARIRKIDSGMIGAGERLSMTTNPAKRTAEIIAEPHRLLIRTDARLREMNQGSLEGKNLEGLLAGHPELLKKWMTAPAEVEMPEGESLRSVQARAWQAIKDITDRHPEELVAVVSHNLCILAIICKAIALDLNNFRRLRMDNASISEIAFGSHGPVLIRINDTAHLGNHRGR